MSELDQNADGFIELDELCDYLKSVGEPLSEAELDAFKKMARDKASDRPNTIDIRKLCDIILPPYQADNALTRGVKGTASAGLTANPTAYPTLNVTQEVI